MKKNLYRFWTSRNNALTVSDTDFVNRDLSKNYAIFILFLSSSPWSKLRPHGVVGNGNNVKTNWRFHTNRAIPVQQTSTPCFSILALTCLQWEDLHLAEPFAAATTLLIFQVSTPSPKSPPSPPSPPSPLSSLTPLFHPCNSPVATLSNPCDTPVSHLLHLCDYDSIYVADISIFSRIFTNNKSYSLPLLLLTLCTGAHGGLRGNFGS